MKTIASHIDKDIAQKGYNIECEKVQLSENTDTYKFVLADLVQQGLNFMAGEIERDNCNAGRRVYLMSKYAAGQIILGELLSEKAMKRKEAPDDNR